MLAALSARGHCVIRERAVIAAARAVLTAYLRSQSPRSWRVPGLAPSCTCRWRAVSF